MSKGTLLRIEHGSIHDGEGLQTVVFLKGCPLRCLWCSTPESQRMEPQSVGGKDYGTIIDTEELMKEIIKDSIFYFHSNGGVTISGGEPLTQPEFVKELLIKSHAAGVTTTMETSMYARFEVVKPLLKHLDLLYTDIKHTDSARHKELTGVGNELILDNISRTSADKDAPEIVVRMPVIPTINDEDSNLRQLGRFCRDLPNIKRIELLPYHKLGLASYKRLGWEYALRDIESPSAERMEAVIATVQAEAPRIEVIKGR